MISYRKGDLFSDDAEALVNTVNIVGVMGKGIALAFKNAFPHNLEVYKQACKNGEVRIGRLLIVHDQNLLLGNRIIINMPTKKHWRDPSAYSFVEGGLIALRRFLIENIIKSVAIPAPGCGNGGLDWHKVKPLLEEHLKDLDTDIRVYEPQ